MTAVPHYLTTPQGQLRLWVAGSGRPVLVLPGLARAAAAAAADVAAAGATAYAVDLPGTGGSMAVTETVAAIRAAAAMLGLDHAILAFDLSAALMPGAVALDAAAARAWAARGLQPPGGTPQADGTHLTALHAHIRNCHVLDPADPSRGRRSGAPLPGPDALHDAVLALAAVPGRYQALWSTALAAAAALDGPPDVAAALAGLPPGPATVTLPAVTPGGAIWCDHVDLPRGRMHLRLAGAGGRPLVALHSAPGGSAPLAPLLHGLGAGRRVIAPDCLGNGFSGKPDGPVDIARLARDLLDLLDALALPTVDLWGTHTGALIALEAALLAPGRVHRLVLEAPPLLDPDFRDDILARYLPPIAPDRWGLHLQQAWNMRRDMFLFWPWYRAERAAIRPLAVPPAEVLHDWTLGLLASGRTYDRSYRAAFEYDTRDRLPRLTRPALICAGASDMLAGGLQVARGLLPAAAIAETPATVWYPQQSPQAVQATLAVYDQFLAA